MACAHASLGEIRYAVTIDAGGRRISADEPPDNGRADAGPAPRDPRTHTGACDRFGTVCHDPAARYSWVDITGGGIGMRGKIYAAAFCIAVAPWGAMAQDMPGMAMPAANCAATDQGLPPALAAWTSKAAPTAATAAPGLDAAKLIAGQAATVTLHPTREVSYVTQPEKPGGSVAHGGMLALNIAEAGTYQVSLNSGAWIDVLKDGVAQTSGAHGHGPACSTIRKMVDFSLPPGRYVIQISANADPKIAIMVSRHP